MPTPDGFDLPSVPDDRSRRRVEDGRLYRSVVPRIGDEQTMPRRVRDAQGRVSDGVTVFAGSVPFVHIHGAWFAA